MIPNTPSSQDANDHWDDIMFSRGNLLNLHFSGRSTEDLHVNPIATPTQCIFFTPEITHLYQQMYIHDRIQQPHSSVCHFGFACMSLLVPMVYGLKT